MNIWPAAVALCGVLEMGEESATNQFKFASELERIFSSAEFARSPVMRRLLRFLIDETLAGRGDQLKAYSVAVDGLGRDPDFDAQTDSYPRVQVGRLRRMLEAYYNRGETLQGERLVIPNGTYRVFLCPAYRKQERPPVPACPGSHAPGELTPPDWPDPLRPGFPETLSAEPPSRGKRRWYMGMAAVAGAVAAGIAAFFLAPGLSDRHAPMMARVVPAPTLLLLPVERSANSPAPLASSMDQVLGDALHRSWVVDVRAPEGKDDEKTTYRLQGVLAGRAGEDLYLTLWSNRNGNRIWTGHVLLSEQGASLSDQLQASIANIIGAFGAIATDQRKLQGSDIRPGYPCLLKNAELRLGLGKSSLPAARKCTEAMLAAAPHSAAVLAAAADVNYRLAVHEPRQAGRLRALGQRQARRALALDPYSPQAQIASAAASVIDGNCLSARVQGMQAVELNPYEAEYQARLGMLLFQCSQPGYERYLTNARRLYPALPAFYSMPVIAAMLERGEKQEALRLALSQTPPAYMDTPFYPITMAIAYAGVGEKARADHYWKQALKAGGTNIRTTRDLLKTMMVSPELKDATGRVLLKTGVVTSLG